MKVLSLVFTVFFFWALNLSAQDNNRAESESGQFQRPAGEEENAPSGNAKGSIRAENYGRNFTLGMLFPYGFTLSFYLSPSWEIAYNRIQAGVYDFETFNLYEDKSDIYEQDGVESETFDLSATEYFMLYWKFPSGGFLSFGSIKQDKHSVEVEFSEKSRTVGKNVYTDLSLNVKTLSKPKGNFVFGGGIHLHFSQSLGFMLSFLTTMQGREVERDEIEIVASKTLASEDLEAFKDEIVKEFEKRIYYRILAGVTYRF